jgi:DNA-binding transcriptional MerR regulator
MQIFPFLAERWARYNTTQRQFTLTEVTACFDFTRFLVVSQPLQNLMPTTYTIAELAREFDITARAIRFYEDQGLLSPKREGVGGRNRVYTPRDRTRLKLTLRGKRLGLTLSEIKSIVDMYESPKDTQAQIDRFLAVLGQQRVTLEQQRADIEMALEEIVAHEDECRRLLGGNHGDGEAGRDAA